MCETIGKGELRMESFGSVIGMTFDRGGCTEILMTQAEVGRFLDALLEIEKQKPKPDAKVVEALRVLQRWSEHFRGEIVAAVPIAKVRAMLLPIVPSAKAASTERDVRELRRILGALAFSGESSHAKKLLAQHRKNSRPAPAKRARLEATPTKRSYT